MSVELKVTLGTVNYTDWLHVTASKVATPSVVAWEDWINVPVTNYNFVIPGLDPANYYVRYYDAATDGALGTLVAELIVNALTGATLYERRFYTVDGPGTYDPASGDDFITDPYLLGKDITAIFKEGFRYLDPADEWSYNDATWTLSVLNGTFFDEGERIAIEIKYSVGNTTVGTSSGLYTGSLDVPEATRTLIAAEINARLRLTGSALTQVITLPALATIAVDNGFYFDNSVGGDTVQPKIILPGANRIRYNGFQIASDEFAEFWIGPGEHLLIRKYNDTYWEVITDYKGTTVGERLAAGYNAHPGTIPEDGRLMDGDEYPRLWWWIQNVLPATHKYTPLTDILDPAFNWTLSDHRIRVGQFFVHSTLKKFRMPNTQLLTERGLMSFTGATADTGRFINYPGGVQEEMIGPHTHPFRPGRNGGIDSNPAGGGIRQNDLNGFTFTTGYVLANSGTEQRTKNIGVVYARRI